MRGRRKFKPANTQPKKRSLKSYTMEELGAQLVKLNPKDNFEEAQAIKKAMERKRIKARQSLDASGVVAQIRYDKGLKQRDA